MSLKEDVFANLDSAFENGCFEKGGYLYGYTAPDIADDMGLNLELPVDDPKELTPHIQEWMQAKFPPPQ